jgi:diacylglycerol kinase family enzyme
MKISLFHNQKAGDSTSLSSIRELIEASGHELVRVFDRESAFGDLSDLGTELVVVAGGDGTVSAAARLLAGRPIPMSILPVGTANNLARSLQGDVSNEQLVARWETARRRRVDLGVARGPWGKRRFLEAVGVGLVPVTMASTKRVPLSGDDAASNITSALARYREVLATLAPRRWRIRGDGEETAGDFLLVEVLNIRSLGPNLVLSPDADPSDGCLNVVTADVGRRDELMEYLSDRIAGREGCLSLPMMHARHVDIHGPGDAHIDDELVRSAVAAAVSISVEAAAVEFLAS